MAALLSVKTFDDFGKLTCANSSLDIVLGGGEVAVVSPSDDSTLAPSENSLPIDGLVKTLLKLRSFC